MEKTAHDLAVEAKKKNIIDMAFGFTAMTRVFEKESDDQIKNRLTQTFRDLERDRFGTEIKGTPSLLLRVVHANYQTCQGW